jgi:3'-phosphoadenosine 5'-phosphosulfate (PAPS) 3'-phosphatase
MFFLYTPYIEPDEEVITTTTTTTTTDTEPIYQSRGNLVRFFENNSYHVTDPADGTKVFVNSSDDMYEDAEGWIWRLV